MNNNIDCIYIQNLYISLTYRSLDVKTGIPSCQWTYRCLYFEGLASLWWTWAGGQHLTDGTDGSRGVSTEVQREVNMTVWGVVWTSSERRVQEKIKRRSSLTRCEGTSSSSIWTQHTGEDKSLRAGGFLLTAGCRTTRVSLCCSLG